MKSKCSSCDLIDLHSARGGQVLCIHQKKNRSTQNAKLLLAVIHFANANANANANAKTKTTNQCVDICCRLFVEIKVNYWLVFELQRGTSRQGDDGNAGA